MKLEDLIAAQHVDIAPDAANDLLEPTEATLELHPNLGVLLARICADAGALLNPTEVGCDTSPDLGKFIARIHSDAEELLARYEGDGRPACPYEAIVWRRRRLERI